MGSKSGTIVSGTTATSYSWTVPTTLMNEIPNDTSADIIITCETYDGSTKVGTSTATVTANVPSSYRPSFTNLTIEDANTKVKNNVGRYLKGQSRVKVTVNGATTTGGATIKSIVVYVDGKAYHGSQIMSDVINKTGTINVYAVITDSRNRTYSTQSSPNQVTFYDYFKPLVSTLTIQRCNSDGTPNTKGQYAKVQIQGSYSRVDGLNQGNIKIESSLRGQNNWKTEFNQSLPSGSNNFSYTKIINNQGQLFNVALSYDIRVTITDEVVDPVRYTEVLPTQNVPFDIGPAGAAVGKMWEPGKGAFQVGGVAWFEEFGAHVLPANTNLNDVTKTGFYRNNQNAQVATMTNTPTNRSFSMIVTNHAGISQLWFDYNTPTEVYHRNYYNGTWKAWSRFSFDGHNHSGADITSGTVPYDRLPVGTGSSQVARGNHTHSDYLEKALIRTGTFTATSSSSTSVSFSSAMSSTPFVFVTYRKTGDNVPGDWGSPKVHSVTTSGFSCIIGGSSDSTARALNYFAISY